MTKSFNTSRPGQQPREKVVPETEQLYRVEWEIQGKREHGRPLSKEVADLVTDQMNNIFPKIHHWAAPVPPQANDVVMT